VSEPHPATRGFLQGNRGWLLGLVLVIGALLRLREAITVPLWFEEIYIAMVARLPIPQLIETLRHDIHPPLHYVIEHFWLALGARSGYELKSLPILLALASIVVCARLTRRMFGAGPALLTAALVAVAHGHVRFTQEAQAFALEGLLVILAVSAAWDWIETRRTRSAVAYVVWGACAMYTHYVSLAILFVLLAWGVIVLRGDGRALARWLGLHAVLVLAFLPQLPTQISQFIQEDAAHHGHFPYRSDWFALGHDLSGANYLIPVYALLALWPLVDRSRRRAASLLLALAILPLLSLRLWSLNFPRETTYVALLLFPLVTTGALTLPVRPLRFLVSAALLLFALHADWKPDRFPEPIMLKRAADELARTARPDDPILHSDTHSLLFFRFYDPAGNHRIVWRADEGIPYFDGGLMVPDTWRITPAGWDSLQARDARWWGVSLNRAQVKPVHGHTRTGAEFDSVARRVPGASSIDFAPVRLWESPAVVRAGGAAGAAEHH